MTSLTPTLTASDFTDADGDSLQVSRFQVRKEDGFYGGEGSYDTTIPRTASQEAARVAISYTIPGNDRLIPGVYYWRVQYQDDTGDWSLF